MSSDDVRRDECILVCKCKNKLKLEVFDFFCKVKECSDPLMVRTQKSSHNQHSKRSGAQSSIKVNDIDIEQPRSGRKYPIKIDFYNEPTEYFKVKWARRNDCLIFVDKYECFIVEFMEDGF